MNTTLPKPKHLSSEYASRFKFQSVAQAYPRRPPYSEEVYEILLDLITDEPRAVLDAGCGPGKIAIGLADKVDRVDAIDFSEPMIRIGKQLPGGNHPDLNWIVGRVEDSVLYPSYALITAAVSLHWMDWDVVFPRFRTMLTTNGFLAIIQGAHPQNPPWKTEEKKLIRKYSTNRDYQPFDFMKELVAGSLFEKHGERTTDPFLFEQSVEHYIESLHSKESLCKESMGPEMVQAFDTELRDLLSKYSTAGRLHFEVATRITWGRPK